jgi:starch phosphorylase
MTLYDILENEISPKFYARDEAGLPREWIARIRSSLSQLTPAYSSSRMVQEYIDRLYLPAAGEFRYRIGNNGAPAAEMRDWEARLRRAWPQLHIGEPTVAEGDDKWEFSAPIYLGDISADEVRVELYAEPPCGDAACVIAMVRGAPVSGSINGHVYTAAAPTSRPIEDYTVRIVPAHAGVGVPAELELILWHK